MLRISRSVSAAARGSIGERDGLIPGQECNKRQRSNRLSNAEGAAATKHRHSTAEAAQRLQVLRRAYAGPERDLGNSIQFRK